MFRLSILGVGLVCGLGLLVRVAKFVVVALVVVGIDVAGVRGEGVVHDVFHSARFLPHARDLRRTPGNEYCHPRVARIVRTPSNPFKHKVFRVARNSDADGAR